MLAVGVRHVADVQGFLDGRKRDFGRVFDLFGIVRHVQSEPSFYLYASVKVLRDAARKLETGLCPAWCEKRVCRSACPLHPQTSYWLGDTNEMAAINTILIIVNSLR